MTKISYTKSFLSYQSQIALLKSRGMLFDDEGKALHLFKSIGYYRFSGYWHPLLLDKEKRIFKPGTNFEAAYNLYKFDRELRHMLIAELEKIEIAVRAKMTHVLSTKYGSFWMEDATLFSDAVKHQSTLAKIEEELQRSDEDFILSFHAKYSNSFPPSFIALEITTFGPLSRLYDNLRSGTDKRSIAEAFGLPDKVFASWLHSLVSVRNLCAHHARIWNRWMRIQPLFPRRPAGVWLTDKSVSNNHIYYVLSMMIYLLNTVNPGHSFSQKIRDLFTKYANVDSRALGFPPSWDVEPLWN
jgi:abortive infection bacteriophage resistance protein